MGIRVEIRQKEETVNPNSLKMGDTFQTIREKERDLYLVCSESDDIEDVDDISAVNLSTGRMEGIGDFKMVIPINLVITKE